MTSIKRIYDLSEPVAMTITRTNITRKYIVEALADMMETAAMEGREIPVYFEQTVESVS